MCAYFTCNILYSIYILYPFIHVVPLVMDTTSIAVSVTIGLVAVVIIAFGASAVIIHWYRVAPFKKTREPPRE